MTNEVLPRPKAKANEPSTDLPHDEHRLRRAKLTLVEALAQGEVIKNALSEERENLKKIAAALTDYKIKRILILGCGDSWFVGMGVRLAFEQLLGIATEAMQALDFALYYHETVDQETIVIGISSSGTTPAVTNALNKAHKNGAFTIGVTNMPGSPLASDYYESIYVRAIRKGWPTQASTAAMALLIGFAIELAHVWQSQPVSVIDSLRQDLDQLSNLVENVLDLANSPMEALAHQLVNTRYILLCGGGPHYAAACLGAAKIKELCPIHALTIPLEEFHHYRSLKPGDPLFLVAPDETSHQRALDTAEVGRYDGGQIFALVYEGEHAISEIASWVLKMPTINQLLAPILYSIPLHLFAYHLAIAKFDKGLGYVEAVPEDET
jgi:glucosamine 6-phosphate synthetase-like amidotransferase/phosphosugar isomerase protein